MTEETATNETATESPSEPEVLWEVTSDEVRQRLEGVFRTVYDPEIPVNVYDLGLIYGVKVEDGFAEIHMTLTAPGCPVAGPLVQEVESKALMVPGIAAAKAELVWDPPWTMERMTEAARLQLGMF